MSIDDQLSKIDREIELKEKLEESGAALSKVQSEFWGLRNKACKMFDEEIIEHIDKTCLDKGFQFSKEGENQIYTYKDHLEIEVHKSTGSLFLYKKVGGKKEKSIQILHSYPNAENYKAKSKAISIEEKMEQHKEAKNHYEALLEKQDTWIIKATFNHLDDGNNTNEVYSAEEVLEYLFN